MSALRLQARPTVLAFLRHVGCPFAEATVRALRAAAEKNPEVAFVAVSQASREVTLRWADAFGGLGERVALVPDEQRALYAEWNVQRTSPWHWLQPRATLSLLPLVLRGIRNRAAAGTRAQSAGTFALDAAGQVRFRHLPRHAGDLPDLAEAARAAAHSQ